MTERRTGPPGEFSMEKGRIVEPLSSEWFKTFSFGDAIKIIAFLVTGTAMFVSVKSDLTHETEMRQLLEARTQEIVSEMRQAQKDNSARTDARFAENQQRDRDLSLEFKSRFERLENKIDQVLATRR